jgi:hypothetical protein
MHGNGKVFRGKIGNGMNLGIEMDGNVNRNRNKSHGNGNRISFPCTPLISCALLSISDRLLHFRHCIGTF